MNLTLKAIYYCANSERSWGKGYTIEEAKTNCRGTNTQREYIVWAALYDNPTKEELENLYNCITADQIGGGPEYYKDDRQEFDTIIINRRHVGWLVIEHHYPKGKKKA